MRGHVTHTPACLALALFGASMASAQPVKVERVLAEAPDVRLGVPGETAAFAGTLPLHRALWHVQQSTGYQIRTNGLDDPAVADRQITGDIDGPAKRVLEEICAQADCLLQRSNPTTFSVSAYGGGADDAPSAKVPGYQIRVRFLDFSLGTHRFGTPMMKQAASYWEQPMMRIRLEIDAADPDSAACIFGLGEHLRVTTDSGQDLAPCAGAIARANSGLDRYPDPTTPSLRVDVALPPPGSHHISIEGEVALWTSVQRVDASLPWGVVGAKASGAGVEIETVGFDEKPDDEMQCALRISKPKAQMPMPAAIPPPRESRYETQARLIWDVAIFALTTPDIGLGDTWRFTFTRPAATEGDPDGVAVSTYVKAQPTMTLPFVIEPVPLPDLNKMLAGVPPDERPGPAAVNSQGARAPLPEADVEREEPGAIEFEVLIDGQPLISRFEWTVPVYLNRMDADDPGAGSRAYFATLQENGRFRLDGISPGDYQVVVRAPQLLRRHHGTAWSYHGPVAEMFGVDATQYVWVDTMGDAEIHPGGAETIGPVRLIPQVETLKPASGGTVPRDEVLFAWKPHAEAKAYRVSLGVWERGEPPAIFWVSDAVQESDVAYDPSTGHVQRESDREYRLEPGINYYWWVSALDGEGETITRSHGGGFFTVR